MASGRKTASTTSVSRDYPVVVAGRGNLGRSLVRAFNEAGESARLVPSREPLPALQEGLVFIAVPDAAVGEVARRMSRSRAAGAVSFVHVSGALGLDVLAPLATRHAVGSFHPLQSFPAPRSPDAFQGITMAVDASTTALERHLASLARGIGARPRHVGDAERVPYHAAAVFASNYVITAVDEGVRVLMATGWTREEAEQALLPLAEGVVQNMRRDGVRMALTGPVRRGDAETVERHLGDLGPEAADLYRMLGLVALEIAKAQGLDARAVGRTRRALTRNVAATRRRGRR